jgi:zinc protease
VKFPRFLLYIVAVLAFAPAAIAQNAPIKQPDKWAQDYLGRQADPAVLFGTLPNGLRYAVLANDTPKGTVAMRMLIGSGSFKERDEERGLAHFIEHLAFRGSANVADGEVVRMLERQGLRLGPDTNAMTNEQRTVFMFNFPSATDEALGLGLMLFREIGERLNFDPGAIESEKRVLLSEERQHDTPSARAFDANIAFLLQGTIAPKRSPIGTVETLRGATAERLRRYYRANYRPDNATIVIVGPVDPAAVANRIKAAFSEWKAEGPAESFDPGTPSHSAMSAEFIAEGAPDSLSLNWVRPLDRRAETEAVDREQLERSLALIALNNRLSERALQPGSAFVGASASANDSVLDIAGLATLAIGGDPAKWREALDAVVEEQRMTLRDGISAEELNRAATALLTQFKRAADAASTRHSVALAEALTAAAATGGLFTSPAQQLEMIQRQLATITPQGATAALRALFEGSQPLVFRSAHGQPAGSQALEQALAAAAGRPLPATVARAAASWPYGDFGAPGAVVSRKDDAELGATIVTFANGTRLIAKQTAFQKDRITIRTGYGSGRAGLAPELAHAGWAATIYPVGGMARLSIADLQRLIQSEGRVVGSVPNLGSRYFSLNGATRPADFLFEMQLLTALAVDPGFRPEMNDQLKALTPMLKTQIDTNPAVVFSRAINRLLHGGDRRFAETPEVADIDATRPEDIPVLVRQQLASPADVAIVGDINVDEAIRVTAATLGAVPRPARAREPDVRIAMTPGREEPFVVRHGGRADQGQYGLVWQLPDFLTDPQLSYTADVAAALIRARLTASVREKLGITYTPQAGAGAAIDLPGLGFLNVIAETPPDKFATMRAAILEVMAALAAAPVSADELDRARTPLVESTRKARENNDFWAQNLATVLREPRARANVLEAPDRLAAVTAQEVQALIKAYVIGKTPITVIAQAREP